MSQPKRIVITIELFCKSDIGEEQQTNLISNSLAWVANRVNRGNLSGNLHHSSGQKYGTFCIKTQASDGE